MKHTIALFLADPYCSVQSGNGIIKALGKDYTFKLFSKNEVEDNFFDNVDLIAIPGGFGDANSFDRLFQHNIDRVQEFVKDGGAYLGICMGAYWAGKYFFNILNGVEPVQYIKRPKADARRPHTKAIDINWQGHPDRMFFYDGCALIGDKSKFKTVATYSNGDAMAITQGRIGLIGCHPESEKGWYDDYSWMTQHWHQGRHHSLLLDFVNNLMI
jgi:hypothetical protein